jgi:hypothetical protein
MRRQILCVAGFLMILLGSAGAGEARTRFSFGFSFGFGSGHYRPYPHHVFRPYYGYPAYVPGGYYYRPYYAYRPYYVPPLVYRSYRYRAPVVRYYGAYPSRGFRSYAPRRDHGDYADYQPRRYYRR